MNPSAASWILVQAVPERGRPGGRIVAVRIRSLLQLCRGEWDMCRNGQYTERGIKEIHGFMSERWRIEPEYAIKVDSSLGILGVLLEPMTVITKALEQVFLVGQRAFWEPKTALVTGAGPIGLLAALRLSARDLQVHVLARKNTGPQPELVRASERRIIPGAFWILISIPTSSSNARVSDR